MLTHVWSVLCRSSSVDRDSNNISLYEVFEELTVDIGVKKGAQEPKEFNIPVEYEVVSLWTKDNTNKHVKAEVKIEVVNPADKKNKEFINSFEMPEKMKRMRYRLRIRGLGISSPGYYKFFVYVKEAGEESFRKVAELPLQINLNKKVVEGSEIKINQQPIKTS